MNFIPQLTTEKLHEHPRSITVIALIGRYFSYQKLDKNAKSRHYIEYRKAIA
jgi:hypothetical protein